jgi:biopolymer transport protein ExbD
MGFGSFSQRTTPAPMAEINVTPMVDVMLVLLVIFIISAPLFSHSIQLTLPQVTAKVAPPAAVAVTVAIDPSGALYWNSELVTTSELAGRMAVAAQQSSPPELLLRADKATRYEVIAQVMAAAQTAGLEKIGFITQPETKKGAR